MSLRSRIQRAFRLRGLTVRPDAALAIENVLNHEDDALASLKMLLESIKKKAKVGVPVDRELVAEVVADLSKDDSDVVLESITVYNAKVMPRLKFNQSSNQFFENTKSKSISEARYFAVRERLIVIKQRLLRNHSYKKAVMGNIDDTMRPEDDNQANFFELTEIDSLSAKAGKKYTLGYLSRNENGEIIIEDLDGKVRVDLSNARFADGLPTFGSVLLFEGRMRDGVFHVKSVQGPVPEEREKSLFAHPHVDFLRRGRTRPTGNELNDLVMHEKGSTDTSFVILSDVYLDNAKVRSDLGRVLETCATLISPVPALFVIMGNLTEQPFGELEGQVSSSQFKEYLRELGQMFARHKNLVQNSQLVIIPGPNDPGSAGLLPQPPLPKVFARHLTEPILGVSSEAKITFGSNPCRVQFYTQEIVLFRQDISNKLHRHCVTMVNEKTKVSEHLTRTLVEQAHLSPISQSVRPIDWTLDSSLRLYPLPNVVFLGEGCNQYSHTHAGCKVANIGSFALDSSFVIYRPALVQEEFSSLPQDES